MPTPVIIAVGSKNPVKVKSALDGVAESLPDKAGFISAVGLNIPSGVSDQPMSDDETKIGATSRARGAFEQYKVENGVYPSYSVGLEGGCAFVGDQLECFAWIVVYNGEKFGSARTASFFLPEAIATLVKGGLELGDADDKVFGSTNNKQSGGTVGHLTNGVIGRGDYYKHAVVFAFIPFLWPDLY
jgi:inosine/xanthosine triphosphatase